MRKFAEAALARMGVRDLEIVVAVLAVAILLLIFLQIGSWISGGPVSFDERILLALRQPGDPSIGLGGANVTAMMRDITSLGSGTVTGLFACAFVGYLLLSGRRGAALFVVIAVLGAWGLNTGLKDLFARERPTIVVHLMPAHEPSFPSGHAMIATTFYPTMAELVGRLTEGRVRFYLMGLAISLALLVSFSRVYLGVHYPTDVLAGLCVGLAWALVCGLVARTLQRRKVIAPAPEAA